MPDLMRKNKTGHTLVEVMIYDDIAPCLIYDIETLELAEIGIINIEPETFRKGERVTCMLFADGPADERMDTVTSHFRYRLTA